MKRIALIHATPLAIDPIRKAFASLWPEAELINILDDSLSKDRNRLSDKETHFEERIELLSKYAKLCQADGILFTCSAFGQAIEKTAASLGIPILKPNEAMFESALEMGNRIGMIATFKPAIEGMEREFNDTKRSLGKEHAFLETVLVEEGRVALNDDDVARHDRLVAGAIESIPECDVYMLAHFSTSTALTRASKKTSHQVLASPESAVKKMKGLLS